MISGEPAAGWGGAACFRGRCKHVHVALNENIHVFRNPEACRTSPTCRYQHHFPHWRWKSKSRARAEQEQSQKQEKAWISS